MFCVMSYGLLNAVKVQSLIRSKGLRQNWVIQQIGLRSTAGQLMLKDGVLPKDETVRDFALKKLSEILGVDTRSILLRIDTKGSKAS